MSLTCHLIDTSHQDLIIWHLNILKRFRYNPELLLTRHFPMSAVLDSWSGRWRNCYQVKYVWNATMIQLSLFTLNGNAEPSVWRSSWCALFEYHQHAGSSQNFLPVSTLGPRLKILKSFLSKMNFVKFIAYNLFETTCKILFPPVVVDAKWWSVETLTPADNNRTENTELHWTQSQRSIQICVWSLSL